MANCVGHTNAGEVLIPEGAIYDFFIQKFDILNEIVEYNNKERSLT